MMKRLINSQSGFTLIELVITILVLGIIATVATRKMGESIETANHEHAKKELDQLVFAMVGNPEIYSHGARTDFGYVGDIGALPPNLNALVQNPGGYATWDGPYIERGLDNDDFKKDAWDADYTYVDTVIRSTGSGSDIDKLIATSSAVLFDNSVSGIFRDANMTMPGATFDDSVVIRLAYPNGSGATTTATVNPNAFGEFTFTGVPIGNHTLSIIYIPETDTVSFPVMVLPGRNVKLDIVFPADLW